MRMRRDEERLVAVAIGRDRRSQMAMKWALDHVLIRGQTVRLIHVNQPQSITSSSSDNEGANRNEPSDQTADIFLAFRCFCSRKEVPWEAVRLEDQDIARAIIDYVSYNRIDTLVLGASSRGLARLFKPDIPSIVLKGVPYFCNVYVIAKGKIISERLASTPLPASSAPPPRRMASAPYRIDQTPGGSIEREEFSVPETEISCISGDRMSTDSTLFDFYDNLGSTLSRAPSESVGMRMSMSMSMNSNQHRRSAVSSACKYVALGSADELPLSNHETTTTSHPPRPSEEVEEKLRKLQLQIKQTMDMYHAACKEALTAKQQVRELQHHLKLENERRLEEVEERAKDRALEIAEEQIERYKAAFHVSEAAYRKAEREAQKRKDVQIKSLRELEDFKKRMANSSPNYKSLFNIVVVLFLFHLFLFQKI